MQTLRVARVRLEAPYRTGTKLPDVELTAVYAREEDRPRGAERIEWILLTRGRSKGSWGRVRCGLSATEAERCFCGAVDIARRQR